MNPLQKRIIPDFAFTKTKALPADPSKKLDRVLTHSFWGLLILLGSLGSPSWSHTLWRCPSPNWIYQSIILTVKGFVDQLLQGSPDWLRSLLVDGVIAGTGTVFSFLPILIIFFTILAVLEGSGYLARTSRITDRYLQHLGLPGKACIPLSLGFGCNTSAILGCRILEDRRSRLLTMLLVPFIPCTSRLAVIAFLTPAFFGSGASLVTWGLILLQPGRAGQYWLSHPSPDPAEGRPDPDTPTASIPDPALPVHFYVCVSKHARISDQSLAA